MMENSPSHRFSKPLGAFLIGLSIPFFAAIFFTPSQSSKWIDLVLSIVLLLIGLLLLRVKSR